MNDEMLMTELSIVCLRQIHAAQVCGESMEGERFLISGFSNEAQITKVKSTADLKQKEGISCVLVRLFCRLSFRSN